MQQAFFAVNQPTRSAVLPKLLPLELLPAANSLNMTVFQAGAIAGPLVAGALIPVSASSGSTWSTPSPSSPPFGACSGCRRCPSTRCPRARPGCGRSSTGSSTCADHPVLLMSFVVDLIAMVFGMPRALFPEIAHLDFRGPDEGGLVFALLFAAIPVGAVARRGLQRLGLADRAPGPGRRGVHPGVGRGDGRLRRGRGAGRPLAGPDAGPRAGDARGRRRGRHGLGGLPHQHAPERGGRRGARSPPGRLHRGGRRRAPDRRRRCTARPRPRSARRRRRPAAACWS